MGIIPGRGATFAQPRFITMRGESSDGPSGNLADGHALSWIRDWRMGGVPEARRGAHGSPAWCSKGPTKSYPTHRERARAFIRTMHAFTVAVLGWRQRPVAVILQLGLDRRAVPTDHVPVRHFDWLAKQVDPRGDSWPRERGSEGARERI